MNTSPPQSIPADKFKPRFDTSTTAGKIAVMQEAERVGYVYAIVDGNNDKWMTISTKYAYWNWEEFKYNFPVEPTRTLIPWTKDTVPRDCWMRRNIITENAQEAKILAIGKTSALVGEHTFTYTEFLADFEHSLDGGKTWLPCGTWKEEV